MAQRKEITGKPTVIKEVNIGLIKDELLNLGQATSVELSKKTGISQPTVNVLMKDLEEKNIVLNLGEADSTGGRRAEVYTLNLKRKHIVSVIAWEDAFHACVFDLELNKDMEKSVTVKEGISHTEALTKLLDEIFEKAVDIDALTIGVPGAVSKEGRIFAIPQIPEWEGFLLKAYLTEKYSVDVMVMNDINAVAMGYLRTEKKTTLGGIKNIKELVYLHVGETGMGAGIIINGKLHCGCNSFAGEVVYMQVSEKPMEEELLKEDGDKRAGLLSRIVTNIICVLDPQEIVLGGRVTEKDAEKIKKGCSQHLPLETLPEFTVISDNTEYYFTGLGTFGQEMLDHQLRLK